MKRKKQSPIQKAGGIKIVENSQELQTDRASVLESVTRDGMSLMQASDQLKNDKDVVLRAIAQNGESLRWASEQLRNDEEVVLKAVKQNGKCLKFATLKLYNDKEFSLKAFSINNDSINQAYPFIRNNKNYISEIISEDKDIFKKCLALDGEMLKFATVRASKDPEIVAVAVAQNPNSISACRNKSPQNCKGLKEFWMQVVEINGLRLEQIPLFKNDKEVVLQAISQNGDSLQQASQELRNDQEVVLQAVAQKGESFAQASEQLRNDKNFVLQAIDHDAKSFKSASFQLRNDKQFILDAFCLNEDCLKQVPMMFQNESWIFEILSEEKDTLKKCLITNGCMLRYASIADRNEEEIVSMAIKQTGVAFRQASEELKSQEHIKLLALEDDNITDKTLVTDMFI